MLPIFNKSIITDGDNVPSEDFAPGEGGRVEPKQSKPKPFPYKKLTTEEKKARDWYYMTEDEKRRIEDDHLTRHGI